MSETNTNTTTNAEQITIEILKGLQLVGTIGPIAMQTAVEIQQIFQESGYDYDASIKVLRDGAVLNAEQTIKLVDAWREQNGI